VTISPAKFYTYTMFVPCLANPQFKHPNNPMRSM